QPQQWILYCKSAFQRQKFLSKIDYCPLNSFVSTIKGLDLKYKTPSLQKFKLFVATVVLFSTTVAAQTKNKIGVHIGSYRFYDVLTSHEAIPSQLGLSYARRVSDKFALVAAYTRAPFYFISKKTSMHGKHKPMTTEENNDDMSSIGKLHTRF